MVNFRIENLSRLEPSLLQMDEVSGFKQLENPSKIPIVVTVKAKGYSQLEYILHLFLKITISAYYNYLQVKIIFLSNWNLCICCCHHGRWTQTGAAPTVGPTPASNRWRHTSSTIGISESNLSKIIISIWPRGYYIQLVCVGQQARRGSDDLRVIWHNSNTYYIHIQPIAVKTN